MKTLEASKIKNNQVMRTFRSINASAESGELPTRIELLKVGVWDTPNHGTFAVTEDDLTEYKQNFDAGIAQAGKSGVMIDYDHIPGIAAGWIKGLDIGTDANGVKTMFADPVEWTGQGKRDLQEKNYKCISPEFYPASRGGWHDPERYGVYIPNVLAAAGLVNRPLFKGLTPIQASADSGETEVEERNVIFISASEKEKSMPKLEEIVVKDANSLSEEEKSFLVEHKEELTDDQKNKFGFEVSESAEAKAEREASEAKANEEAEAAKAQADAEAAPAAQEAAQVTPQPVLASAVQGSEGTVMVAASEVKALHDFKVEHQRKDVEAFVDKHIARGAIKASEKDTSVKLILSSQNRSDLESMFDNLPDNPVLAGETGSSQKAGDAKTATEQLDEKANAKVAASEGKVTYANAILEVRRENPELAKASNEESENKSE